MGTSGTQTLIYGFVANHFRTNVRGAAVALVGTILTLLVPSRRTPDRSVGPDLQTAGAGSAPKSGSVTRPLG